MFASIYSVLFFTLNCRTIFNLWKFLSVYDHVLWRLVVILETVIDGMIDICICFTLTDNTCTLHIQLNEHLFYHNYSCTHVKWWIMLVNLYDHAPHVSYYMYYFSLCLIMLLYYICKSIWSCTPCILLHVLFSFCLIMLLYHICRPIWSHTLYACLDVCYIVVLWTILSLMPTTSHPKAIGGVC